MRLELSKNEIANIISKHFSVDVDKVSVVTKREIQGYGMGEHSEEVPVAYVEGDFYKGRA